MTRIYAAMEDELILISEDNGRLKVERRLEGSHPHCLTADPLKPEVVYCGTTDQGLWRSPDAGASWRPAGEGISHQNVTAVTADGESGVVYAGTEPSAIFRSENGGDSWRELERLRELPSSSEWSFPPRPWTSHVRWISTDPIKSERLFVCIEAGALVRSGDGGETWEDRVPDGPIDTHTLSLHKDVPDLLYSAAGDGVIEPGFGYSESRDGGETWERFADGLNHHYLWGLAVDPADSHSVIVSAASGPRQAHSPDAAESTIYRRAGGGPWREVREGLPETEGRISSVLASSAEPGVFHALNNHGIYRSADAGKSWEALDIPWPERYRHQRPRALLLTGDV